MGVTDVTGKGVADETGLRRRRGRVKNRLSIRMTEGALVAAAGAACRGAAVRGVAAWRSCRILNTSSEHLSRVCNLFSVVMGFGIFE